MGWKRRLSISNFKELLFEKIKFEDRLKWFRERNCSVFVPQLLLGQERLLRNITINSTLYGEPKYSMCLQKFKK